MCCLCCDVYKLLAILVFSGEDQKPQAPSHSSFTVLILVRRKRTRIAVRKEQEAQSPLVWYNLSWVGWILKGFILYWDVRPVSSPVTVVNSIKINIVIFFLPFSWPLVIQVVYRSGISEKCPEGDKWIEIPSPQVSITQLSVSPSGVVWGVTWEGVAVVRSGVTCYEPFGEQWPLQEREGTEDFWDCYWGQGGPHPVTIPETIAGHILLQFPLVSLMANSDELFLAQFIQLYTTKSRPYFLEVFRDPLCERLGVRFRGMALTGGRHSLICPKRVCR